MGPMKPMAEDVIAELIRQRDETRKECEELREALGAIDNDYGIHNINLSKFIANVLDKD